MTRGPFCANTERSEPRDKTVLGCSTWYRMLALDSFSWRARAKVDSNARDAELCVLSDHGQKEGDGITCQRQCTRTRSSGRLRENAVPRHRQAMGPKLIIVRPKKTCQNVFRSLRCFLGKSTRPHIDVDSEKCSPRLDLHISCARPVVFRTSTCHKRCQVHCCRTIAFCRAPLSRSFKPDRKLHSLNNYTDV